MLRIKSTIAIIALAASGAQAQVNRTIYYDDSSVFFKGKILFLAAESRFSSNVSLSWNDLKDPRISISGTRPPLSAEQHFTSAMLEGEVNLYYKDGKPYIKQNFEKGIAQGKIEVYYMNGNTAMTGTYKDGTPDGKWAYYYEDGTAMFQGSFKAYSQDYIFARRTGTSSSMPKYPSRVQVTNIAAAEKEHNAFQIFERFLAGLSTELNGDYNFYYAGGKKNATLQLDKNVANGVWEMWDRDGKTTHRIEFKNGEMIALFDPARGKMIPMAEWKKAETDRVSNQQDQEVTTKTNDVAAIDPGIDDAKTTTPMPAILEYVEQMPEPGFNFEKWLLEHLKYPEQAKKNKVEGRVIVRFVVRKDGTLSDVKALRLIGGGCDEEAVRLIKSSPKWKPGKQNGKTVDVWYTKPIDFRLN